MESVNKVAEDSRRQEACSFSIKNDLVFKAVFGREDVRCKIILADLLNAILDLHGEHLIKELVYKNPLNLQNLPTDKLSIMDIKVKTGTEEWIDIEMQVNADKNYRKRSLYYWSSLYKDSLSSAEAFKKLKKCIVINITDKRCIFESNRYHTHFQVVETTDHFLLTDHLDIHFIALDSFDVVKPIEEMNEIEEWVTFLKDPDNIVFRKEEIKLANKVLEEITADEQMREMLVAIEKARRDQISREYDAREEGLEEGIKEGIKEGKNIGIVTVLKIMEALKDQMRTDDILKQFDITIEQLLEIKKHQ